MRRLALTAVFSATALASAPPGKAAEGDLVPPCNEERMGLVACVAGKLCACGHAQSGKTKAGPAGFRWDCGALRPSCGAPAPATLDPYPYPLPPGLSLESSRTTVTTVTGGRGRAHNRLGEPRR